MKKMSTSEMRKVNGGGIFLMTTVMVTVTGISHVYKHIIVPNQLRRK